MATLLYRLGKTAFPRWPIFLPAWLVALIGLGTVAGTLSKPMSDSFSIPGVASVEAAELQQKLSPAAAAADAPSGTIVVAAPQGHTLAEKRYAGAVTDLVTGLRGLDDVPDTVVGPAEAAARLQAQVTAGVDQAAAASDAAGQPFDRAAALAQAQAQVAAAT